VKQAKRWTAVVVFGAILALAGGSTSEATLFCGAYYNSAPTYILGYGLACAGSGGDCTECTFVGGGGGVQTCLLYEGIWLCNGAGGPKSN
jgi:hypothetical protein